MSDGKRELRFEVRHGIRIFRDTWKALREGRITPRAAMLEAHVTHHICTADGERKKPHWDFTMPELVQSLQCTRMTVWSTIGRLVKANMLKVERTGRRFRMRAKVREPGIHLAVPRKLLEQWESEELHNPMRLLLSRAWSFWKSGKPFLMTNVGMAKQFGVEANTISHLIADLEADEWDLDEEWLCLSAKARSLPASLFSLTVNMIHTPEWDTTCLTGKEEGDVILPVLQERKKPFEESGLFVRFESGFSSG